MALIDDVNERRLEIRTDHYSMSIGEWVSLYTSKEIDIHPEFQRFFRWSEAQKTSLIESILLGIPIPPIFVSQRDNGVWDVVDGLQRLSTIYQFIGLLRNEEDEVLEPLKLTKTKYLPSLEGVLWDDQENPGQPFTQDLRLIVKRSKINVSIILKESDENAKYDLFQRLNTGGSDLSPQEVRNCILVMLNKDFYLWLKDLANYQSFQDCISLSDRPIKESYDLELALRFILFSLIEDEEINQIGDVGIFITEKMSDIAKKADFDYQRWERLFKDTFDLLNEELGDSSFKRYNAVKDKFMGGFLLSQFEVVAFGIAFNIQSNNVINNVRQKIADIWSNPDYTQWSGSGITATRRLPRLIPFGRGVFSNGN